MLQSFRETNDETEACATCFDYPNCFMLKKCQASHHCFPEVCEDNMNKMKHKIRKAYTNFKNKNSEENEEKD